MDSAAVSRDQRSAGESGTPATAPTFDNIAEEFLGMPGVGRGKTFGQPVLKVDGKVFASCQDDQLVVKLPPDRIDALVANGRGAPFTAHGKTMRGWIVVPATSAEEWLGLTEEALAFVRPS